jgi:cytochrome P450
VPNIVNSGPIIRPDLGDPNFWATADRHEALAELREIAPIRRVRSAVLEHDFWAIFTYSEIRQFLADDKTFASRYGVFPWNGPHFPDPSAQSILIASDDPRRSIIHATMKDAFSRSAFARHKTRLSQIARELLLPRIGGPPFDFGSDVASAFAIDVMAELIGFDPADDRLHGAIAGVLGNARMDNGYRSYRASAREAFAVAADVFNDMLAERDGRRGHELLDRLETAARAGVLTRRDVLTNLIGVLVGGHEAPWLVLTGMLVHLAQEPWWLPSLREQPELMAGMVEEVLRWTAPTTMIGRTAMNDVVLGGAHILTGEVVRAILPAANRDPARYRDPDTFDPTRKARDSLVFGHGPHRCIGHVFAREGVTAVLEILRDNVGGVELAGPPTMASSSAFAGYAGAPLILHPIR